MNTLDFIKSLVEQITGGRVVNILPFSFQLHGQTLDNFYYYGVINYINNVTANYKGNYFTSDSPDFKTSAPLFFHSITADECSFCGYRIELNEPVDIAPIAAEFSQDFNNDFNV